MSIKAADVRVGDRFLMKHTSGFIIVEVREILERSGFTPTSRRVIHFRCRNEKTGRFIEVKSAVRFRERASDYEARLAAERQRKLALKPWTVVTNAGNKRTFAKDEIDARAKAERAGFVVEAVAEGFIDGPIPDGTPVWES